MNDSAPPAKVVPRFEPLVGQSGIHVHDPVEDVQAILYTDRPVSPRSASLDEFVYPVDSATEVTVSRLRTPFLIGIWIRDAEGALVEEFEPDDGRVQVSAGSYILELAGMGLKLYVSLETTGFTVTAADNAVDVVFDTETVVSVGARSLHSQPARTLVTTSDPTDMMEVVSLFGNAMKTWSPERTFPSLRGHPPLLEVGPEPEIPDDLTPPDTGITITTRPEYEWLYPVVPLAYWLGATVEPGSPALTVGGERYSLVRDVADTPGSERETFERHVRDVLQFSFMLDCAVRTEGFYDVDLEARRRVEAAGVSLDFEALYDASLAERLRTYLDLERPFDELASHVGRPGWRLTTDVQPDHERISTMPFLARDLSVVRCPATSDLERPGQGATDAMEDVFARSSAGSGSVTDAGSGVATRSSSDSSAGSGSRERIIGLPDADSTSQAWVGDGFAIGAAKASAQSYLQRLEKHAEGNSGINIDVVVNDEEMADEATVSSIYGTREHLAFDVDLHRGLSIDALADVFESDTDFVHYIGHVEREGFDCTDGYLGASQLGTVGADTFVLNACASYEQGQALVDRGAIAGVVTLEDVIDSLATKVGKTVAGLLNYGFPIGSATGLIQETIFTGSNYVVVGDSNAALAQSNVPIPNVARISLEGDGRFAVTVETFASWNYDVGSMYRPYIEGCDCQYVVPGTLDTWTVTGDELNDFLDISAFPVIARGTLTWSDETTAAELRDRLDPRS